MSRANIKDSVRQSPAEFIYRMIKDPDGKPVQPHKGQLEILEALEAGIFELVIRAGRQWGKSMMLAWFVVWWMLRYPNRHVRIIAPTLDQARIIFNQVAVIFEQWPFKLMLKKKIVYFPFPHIALENGTECHARGANSPQFIRGQPTHMAIIDEAAFIRDGIHANVIEPLFTVTGQMDGAHLIRISTPFGRGDFYDGWMAAAQNTSGESRAFHYSSLDNPYADKKRLFSIRDRYGEKSLIWQTEYMAEFVDSDLAIFAWEDIKWAYENYPYANKENGDTTFPVSAVRGHRYVQGVDMANRRDYFVSSILDATGQHLFPLVRMDRQRGRGWVSNKGIVRSNYNAYNSASTIIDATSLGESILEDLQDIRAEGFTYTSTSKYDLVHNLVGLLNEHRLVFPPDPSIISEFQYFQYDIRPSGAIKMEAKQGHDDIVMSIGLAAWKANQPLFTGFFMPVDIAPLTSPDPAPIKRSGLKESDPYDPFESMM